MEEIVLKADLDENTSVYISPIARQTYEEHIQDDSLGGERGYFLLRSRRHGEQRLEVLAKLTTLEAACELFDMIVPHRKSFAR